MVNTISSVWSGQIAYLIAVPMRERIRMNSCAGSNLRNSPETLARTLFILKSRSAWLLVNSASGSTMMRNTSSSRSCKRISKLRVFVYRPAPYDLAGHRPDALDVPIHRVASPIGSHPGSVVWMNCSCSLQVDPQGPLPGFLTDLSLSIT